MLKNIQCADDLGQNHCLMKTANLKRNEDILKK